MGEGTAADGMRADGDPGDGGFVHSTQYLMHPIITKTLAVNIILQMSVFSIHFSCNRADVEGGDLPLIWSQSEMTLLPGNSVRYVFHPFSTPHALALTLHYYELRYNSRNEGKCLHKINTFQVSVTCEL